MARLLLKFHTADALRLIIRFNYKGKGLKVSAIFTVMH